MTKEFISELSFKFDLTVEEKGIVEYLTELVLIERQNDVVDSLSAWLLNRKMWLAGMLIDGKDPATLFSKMRTQPKIVLEIVKRHFSECDARVELPGV